MSLRLQFELVRGALELGVDLTVAAGETLALVGPNGAGKSTCLAAIAGLVAIARGCIALGDEVFDDGRRAAFVPPERRGIGSLFQDHLLFPHLSVLDNVAYGRRCRGARRAAAQAVAREWLARTGIAELAAARPRELSGGQAQRVALARALAADPRILLLDEPLAAVDAAARRALRRELAEHLRTFAGPRLVVTHDPVDAFALADRVAVLEGGRLVQVGAPAELGRGPRSRYVADFVGLNCFRGSVRGGVFALASGAHLVVVTPHDGPALATIHPRSVALFLARPQGSPRNCWQATIAAVEPAQGSVRIQLGGDVPLVAEVTAGSVEGLGLAPGGRVWVAVKATEIGVSAA
ncbi:MAG: ABC transporter ATP-binding protein [Planctomycetota bacterium]